MHGVTMKIKKKKAGKKLWKLKANHDDMPDTTKLHSTDLHEVKEN